MSVQSPRYDRANLKPGIVHIGLGNFHRAHMAVYLDDLFNLGLDHDWAILGAGVRAGDARMRDALKARICAQIRGKASPRHVPNEIYAVAAIPHTLTGKKMEVPVRKLLLGADPAKVANPDTMANPESIAFFLELARQLNAQPASA